LPTPGVFVASDLSDSTKKLFDCADAAITAITEFEKLLFGDGNPLPERLTAKYKPRCKSMVTRVDAHVERVGQKSRDHDMKNGATRVLAGLPWPRGKVRGVLVGKIDPADLLTERDFDDARRARVGAVERRYGPAGRPPPTPSRATGSSLGPTGSHPPAGEPSPRRRTRASRGGPAARGGLGRWSTAGT
jgi:hypothetical protein